MRQINHKMEKRLNWIKPKDERQAAWLQNYILSKDWGVNITVTYHASQYVENFISHAKFWFENADTRERCKNLKAAWQSWDKRDQNKRSNKFSEGAYTISSTARNQLERLAKADNSSFSGVIEKLLLNANEIKHLQTELARVLKEKRIRKISVNCDFLSTFFSDDALEAKAELVTQQIKENLRDQENKLTKSTKTLKETLTEIKKVKKELEYSQEENNKLKAKIRELKNLGQET